MSDQVEPKNVFGKYRKVVASAVATVVVGVLTQDPLVTFVSAAGTFGVFELPNVITRKQLDKALSKVDQGAPEDPLA